MMSSSAAVASITPLYRAGEAVALISDVANVVWNHWPVNHRIGRAAEGALHRSQLVHIAALEDVDRPRRFTFERRAARSRRPRALPPELRSHVLNEIGECARRLDLRAESEADPIRREQLLKLAAIVNNLGVYVRTEPDQ